MKGFSNYLKYSDSEISYFQIAETTTLYQTKLGIGHFVFIIFIYIEITAYYSLSFFIAILFGRSTWDPSNLDNFSPTPPPEPSPDPQLTTPVETQQPVNVSSTQIPHSQRRRNPENFHISSRRNRKLQVVNSELQSLINVLGENNTDPTIVNAVKVISDPHSNKKNIVDALNGINASSLSPNIRALIYEYLTERH